MGIFWLENPSFLKLIFENGKCKGTQKMWFLIMQMTYNSNRKLPFFKEGKTLKRAIFTLLFTWKWKKWNVSNFFINISINNHHEFNFYIFSTLFWGIPCFFTSKDNKVINLPFLLYLTLWCNLCKWIQHGLKKFWSIHDASMCLRASVKMKVTKIMSTRL